MSHTSPPPGDPDLSQHPAWNRVLTRVRNAELASDRRDSARVARRRRLAPTGASEDSRSTERRREARALRRVFVDLGDCYREYRRRTGAAVSPEVRAAALHFQRESNLASLVGVAVSLDRLEPLIW